MARLVRNAACLGLLAVAVADKSLQDRVAALERLLAQQEELLQAQALELHGSDGSARRLQVPTLPKSIHYATGDTDSIPYTSEEKITGALDHIWLILCGALVMFMQAGFAMVEAGSCRAKNVQNILLKNLTDVCVGTIGWWASGWAFAYGGPMTSDGLLENGFVGSQQFFGVGFVTYKADGQLEPTTGPLNWFFQWAFCSAAATIVSGGVAERVAYAPYVVFSFLMTAWVYPVIVAWTWGYGWLASVTSVGFMDFAGSGVVHMTGGVGALVGAAIAGPRSGRFQTPDEFGPHSLPLMVLGTFILWFGWYGFNCGSTLGMADNATGMLAAQVAMNTTIAAATGGLVVFILRLIMLRKYDIGGFCNGILAGLVSITAPCGNVESFSAFFIAIIGALVYQGASSLLKKVKVDDPIDAFAVHGAAGAWGVLAAALFDWGNGVDLHHGWSGFACTADDTGCIKGGNGDALAANLLEVIMIFLWSGGWTALIFLPFRVFRKLRVSDEDQEYGIDSVKHSPAKAYSYSDMATGSASPSSPSKGVAQVAPGTSSLPVATESAPKPPTTAFPESAGAAPA